MVCRNYGKDLIDTLSGAAGTLTAGVNSATYAFADLDNTIWNDAGTIKTTTPASSLATADVITTDLISRAVARMKLMNPKVRPIRVSGKDYYLLLVHPETAHELKTMLIGNLLNNTLCLEVSTILYLQEC